MTRPKSPCFKGNGYSTETAFKNAIVKLLRARGIVCWRAGAGAYQVAGVPDIIAALPPHGQMLAIEAKQPGNGPTPIQHMFHKQLRDIGVPVIVATYMEDVLHFLEEAVRQSDQLSYKH
jgi:Holliday junction resolvase